VAVVPSALALNGFSARVPAVTTAPAPATTTNFFSRLRIMVPPRADTGSHRHPAEYARDNRRRCHDRLCPVIPTGTPTRRQNFAVALLGRPTTRATACPTIVRPVVRRRRCAGVVLAAWLSWSRDDPTGPGSDQVSTVSERRRVRSSACEWFEEMEVRRRLRTHAEWGGIRTRKIVPTRAAPGPARTGVVEGRSCVRGAYRRSPRPSLRCLQAMRRASMGSSVVPTASPQARHNTLREQQPPRPGWRRGGSKAAHRQIRRW
jgi:hypothetical protein